jgi:hypothetical protein
MRVPLKAHPDTPPAIPFAVEVELSILGAGKLKLHYSVIGSLGELSFPKASAPERRGELWQHTCFEAFIRPESGKSYYEFNFSPSGEWAAYSFTGHRTGMASPPEMLAPGTETRFHHDRFELLTALELAPLQGLARASMWQIGISAILEQAGGERTFWALAHPPGDPDFHHSDCFALKLAAPNGP